MSSAPIRHVLVVEDCENDMTILQIARRKAGLQTELLLHFVSDGDEAVRYLIGEGHFADRQEYPLPHAVLLDLHMPKLDGFEVLAWIRTTAPFKNLEVVVWTGSSSPHERAASIKAGADRCVLKPVLVEELVAFVTTLAEPNTCLTRQAALNSPARDANRIAALSLH